MPLLTSKQIARCRNEASSEDLLKCLRACGTQVELSKTIEVTLKKHENLLVDIMLITPRMREKEMVQALRDYDKTASKDVAVGFFQELQRAVAHCKTKRKNSVTGERLTKNERAIVAAMNNTTGKQLLKASVALRSPRKNTARSPRKTTEDDAGLHPRSSQANSTQDSSDAACSPTPSSDSCRKRKATDDDGGHSPSDSTAHKVKLFGSPKRQLLLSRRKSVASLYKVPVLTGLKQQPSGSSAVEEVVSSQEMGSPSAGDQKQQVSALCVSARKPASKSLPAAAASPSTDSYVDYFKGFQYVRRYASGETETAVLSQGVNGFVMAAFPGCAEVETEMPNLRLEIYGKPVVVQKKPAAKSMKKKPSVAGQKKQASAVEEPEAEEEEQQESDECVEEEEQEESCSQVVQKTPALAAQKKPASALKEQEGEEEEQQCVEEADSVPVAELTEAQRKAQTKAPRHKVLEKLQQTQSQLVNLTRQDRLLLRPLGCSRCRWVFGCTPSCWKQLGWQ